MSHASLDPEIVVLNDLVLESTYYLLLEILETAATCCTLLFLADSGDD